MVIKAVIFDNDGVLVDSEILYAKANVSVIGRLYTEPKIEDIIELTVGKDDKTSKKSLSDKYGIIFNEEFFTLKEKEVDKAFRKNLDTCKNVKSMLNTLNYPIAVASNAEMWELDLKHNITCLDKIIERSKVFSGTDIGKPKPAPDVYLLAAQSLNTKAENCLVIEDSETGIKAGVNAEMTVFGYTGASHVIDKCSQTEKLLNAGAILVFNDMAELPKLIEDFNKRGNI